MQFAQLSDEQKAVVRRYALCARAWRRKDREFATLESDLAAGYEVVVDGIAVDGRPGYPVIIGDAKDPEFFAAMFQGDNSAVPLMRADDLDQLRRYIIHGEGDLPTVPARFIDAHLNPHATAEEKSKSRYP